MTKQTKILRRRAWDLWHIESDKTGQNYFLAMANLEVACEYYWRVTGRIPCGNWNSP
jgi:hypothetical protein